MKLEPFMLERYFAPYEMTAKYLLCASDSETQSLQAVLALESGSNERLLGLRLGPATRSAAE